MNHKENLKNIKELVGLAKQETAKEVDVVEEVVLSTEEVVEEVVEEAVELSEEALDDFPTVDGNAI